MSLIKSSYSNKLAANPIEAHKKSTWMMIVFLMGVALVHIGLAFYLLKKIPLEKTEPLLLMSIEMHSGATKPTEVAKPLPTKDPEKPKTVKTPANIKKPAPIVIKDKSPEPIPAESPALVTQPVTLPTPAVSAPAVTTQTQPNTPAPNSKQPPTTNSAASSGVIPLFRVPPEYPSIATRRHIEGWVKVEFTVKTDGTVDNAVVISAEPEEIFNEAALTAIKKWKFKEKIVDGTPVSQRAVQKLQFKLDH